jgi:hypothetical protein
MINHIKGISILVKLYAGRVRVSCVCNKKPPEDPILPLLGSNELGF